MEGIQCEGNVPRLIGVIYGLWSGLDSGHIRLVPAEPSREFLLRHAKPASISLECCPNGVGRRTLENIPCRQILRTENPSSPSLSLYGSGGECVARIRVLTGPAQFSSVESVQVSQTTAALARGSWSGGHASRLTAIIRRSRYGAQVGATCCDPAHARMDLR